MLFWIPPFEFFMNLGTQFVGPVKENYSDTLEAMRRVASEIYLQHDIVPCYEAVSYVTDFFFQYEDEEITKKTFLDKLFAEALWQYQHPEHKYISRYYLEALEQVNRLRGAYGLKAKKFEVVVAY